jgi:NADPH-dependent curcumin reductase CurA
MPRTRSAIGYDAAIDYKDTDDLEAALAASCPDGIDAFFDNTSGAIHDAVLGRINLHARIAICGTASYPAGSPGITDRDRSAICWSSTPPCRAS